jgi:putative membrane protein
MIRSHSDRAANTRIFLAWVRTGMAVIGFGFVVEQLDVLALSTAAANASDAACQSQLERLLGRNCINVVSALYKFSTRMPL